MCHGHSVAYFLACSHLAVHVVLSMAQGMPAFEVEVVASDPLPQPALLSAPALLCVLGVAPVAEGFDLQFQYPILSGGETVLEVTERLFSVLRVAMAMLLVEH